jgi:hypothetical protein
MRNLVLGALLGAGVVAATAAGRSAIDEARAQSPAMGYQGGGELITHHIAADEHRQQLTVIDPRTRVACVYHIDRDTGEISLKSVRNLHFDLQLTEFNSTSPRPREIRAMLEQQ